MNAINVYNRCISGKPYTEDFKIYSKKYLLSVIRELESLEEFEKCIELGKFIEKRFNHKDNYSNISNVIFNDSPSNPKVQC